MNDALKQFIGAQGWSMFGVVGFQHVRDALGRHEGVFEHWLSQGYAADMDWLMTMQADRFHPENKLPDIQSVIVLGAWYGSEPPEAARLPEGAPESMSDGIVARYARGRDYHKVLKKKLIDLSDWLKSQNPLAQTYASVDSGPTVDRVLAEAAGLGFFGKNSCLIDPSKGSYFFIASLMTNLNLSETPKRRMPSCGSCTRCIDKCPTGAIKAPGVIDANKCISYLTIENKGGIPPEFRAAVGNRLFGCDICQEVCPFNVGRAGKQSITIEEIKGNHGAGELLDLRDVLTIRTDEEFTQKFAGTPLMRAKRRGLLRNACVVAGNSGDRELISSLEEFLDRETDDMLREHAAWAIEQLAKRS